MTTSSITAGYVLDLARSRHGLLGQSRAPDGALLQNMSARQRTLMLQHGGAVDGLVNTTVDLALVINGALVGNDGGVPVYGTTYADGWPIHQTADGVPYVDFSEPALAGDPFGENGGTPGFPLPGDFLKLILTSCVYGDGTIGTLAVVDEKASLHRQRSGPPTAFISGNRLVPLRPLAAGNSGDPWSANIASVRLSYVALPVLTVMTDLISLPAVLHEPLIAGMAETLAFSVVGMSNADKAALSAAARNAEAAVSDFSIDVLGAATPSSVRYRA